jgi:quercetin dioxygenase-like cupin family protein/DNA-binding transcriptional regulator YiaG
MSAAPKMAARGAKAAKPKQRPAKEPLPVSSAIGIRIKHARTLRGLTLKQLAARVGLSEGMLSKVENGLATPSLASLHQLALCLDSNVAELVTAPDSMSPVLHAGQHPIVDFPGPKGGPKIKLERVVPPRRGQLIQGDIHVIEPGAESMERISHAGEEIGYVIEGQFELRVGEEAYLLSAGATFYFPSDVPHGYRNPGRTTTRVFWINSPPTF